MIQHDLGRLLLKLEQVIDERAKAVSGGARGMSYSGWIGAAAGAAVGAAAPAIVEAVRPEPVSVLEELCPWSSD